MECVRRVEGFGVKVSIALIFKIIHNRTIRKRARSVLLKEWKNTSGRENNLHFTDSIALRNIGINLVNKRLAIFAYPR